MDLPTLLNERASDCDARTSKLRSELNSKLPPLLGSLAGQIAIYVTGSIARREGTGFSDLDAFFLVKGSEQENLIGRSHDIRILNCVMEVANPAYSPGCVNGRSLPFWEGSSAA